MYGKLLLFILLAITVPVGAQKLSLAEKVTRQVASASLKNSALAKVRFPNLQVGKEALRLHISSVGVGDYYPKVRRYTWANSLLPNDKILKRLKDSNWLLSPMPGYISSSKALASFVPAQEAVLLTSAYAPATQYLGVFVPTFEDLRALSFQPVGHAMDALSALQMAARQAAVKKAGFLAVLVQGNSYRPKDLLIWDPSASHWISWNYSKAAVLRANLENMQQEFGAQNTYWAWQLEQQGVIIRPNSYDYPTAIRISSDGINWQEVSLNTRLGDALWTAWNEGLYISYDRHAHTARFAASKEDPQFSTVEEVQAWKTYPAP